MLMVPLWLTMIGFLIVGLVQNNHDYLRTALYFLGGIPCFALILFIIGSSIRCPLCQGHLMRRASCSVSSKAKRTFGSLRLKIATGALFQGNFRCPYCGEHCDTTTPRRQ